MEGIRTKKKKMQASPSRRETVPVNCRIHTKNAIGCMSGIFQLLSRNNSRRRIPSAAMKEKIEAPPPKTSIPTPLQPDLQTPAKEHGLSQRSPTLPLEIRRSGRVCFDRVDSPRRAPALVARLMGLEDPPLKKLPKPTPSSSVKFSSESAEEKRQKLIGALERCDEDLRVLKRIIDAVRAAEKLGLKSGSDSPVHEMKCLDGSGEQPSPVSVLDGFPSPKFRATENEDEQRKAWSSSEAISSPSHNRRIKIEGIPRQPPKQEKTFRDHHSSSAATKEFCAGRQRWRSDWRRSNGMADGVGDDAEGEERREAVRVGSELADDLAGDLVSQLALELMGCCSKLYFQTERLCKRKLCL